MERSHHTTDPATREMIPRVFPMAPRTPATTPPGALTGGWAAPMLDPETPGPNAVNGPGVPEDPPADAVDVGDAPFGPAADACGEPDGEPDEEGEGATCPGTIGGTSPAWPSMATAASLV